MGEAERSEVPKKTVERREQGWQSAAQNRITRKIFKHTPIHSKCR